MSNPTGKLSRTQQLKVRFSDIEVKILDEVAEAHGLDRPSVVRMLVMKEHRELFGAACRARQACRDDR